MNDTEQIDEAPRRADYKWPSWAEQFGGWTPAPEVGTRFVRLAVDDDRDADAKAYRPPSQRKGGRIYRRRSSVRADIVAGLAAVQNGLILADILRVCRHGEEKDWPHETTVRENVNALCATGIVQRDGPKGTKGVRYFLTGKTT